MGEVKAVSIDLAVSEQIRSKNARCTGVGPWPGKAPAILISALSSTTNYAKLACKGAGNSTKVKSLQV